MMAVGIVWSSIVEKAGEEDLKFGKIREDPQDLYTQGNTCTVCAGMLESSIYMTCNLSPRETFGARALHGRVPSDNPIKTHTHPITGALSWRPWACINGAGEVTVTL